MCYYDSMVFACGDWKWLNFRGHCQKEYRMGETCGMKLVRNTIDNKDKCNACLAIEKKQRRYQKAYSDYQRWQGDPTRKASAAKALEECDELFAEIKKMTEDKQARYMNVGSNRKVNQYSSGSGSSSRQ